MARALTLLLSCMSWLNAGTPREVYVKHKTAHALVGLGVFFVSYELGYPKTGLSIDLALAVGKELYDSTHGGRFRVGDIAWTVLPATAFYLAIRW